MSHFYTPKSGSLAEKVTSYLRLHPYEVLTLDEVIDKFGPVGGRVPDQLAAAIENGWLRAGMADDEPAYAAGKNLPELQVDPSLLARKAGPDAQGKPKKKRGGTLPALDMDAIQVDKSVPPPQRGQRRGESKWTPLLAKLQEPGDSIQLPRQYNGSLTTYLRKISKANPADSRKFKIGLDHSGINRLWRIA